jgi:hypothetical protein
VKACRILILPWLLLACPGDDSSDSGNDTGGDDGSDTPSSDPTSMPDSSGGDDDGAALGCAADLPEDAMDGTMTGIMAEWGAPCDVDGDCVTLLGDGAVCLKAAVIYELPLGYCSKPCELPDGFTGIVADDPMCDAAGGVSCLGVEGTFEYCTVPCTDNAQCERAGYFCRQMPLISMEGDPTFCLMPDCCENEAPPEPGCAM